MYNYIYIIQCYIDYIMKYESKIEEPIGHRHIQFI